MNIENILAYFINKAIKEDLSKEDIKLLEKLRKLNGKYKELISVLIFLKRINLNKINNLPTIPKEQIKQLLNITPATPEDILTYIENKHLHALQDVANKLKNATILQDFKSIKQLTNKLNKLVSITDIEKESIKQRKLELMRLNLQENKIYPSIDVLNHCGGIDTTDFIVFGAGTGVGKTTILLTIAKSLMRQKLDVLYIDWEAQNNAALRRLIETITPNSMDYKLWLQHPIIFNNHTFYKNWYKWLEEIFEMWREEHLELTNNYKEYPDIIIIDYLQAGCSQLEFKEVEQFLRGLYNYCSSKEIPIITASQLNKKKNTKKDKKLPDISDLYGYSNLSHSATKIFTLIRIYEEEERLIEVLKQNRTYFNPLPLLINVVKNRSKYSNINKIFFTVIDLNKLEIYLSKDMLKEEIDKHIQEILNTGSINDVTNILNDTDGNPIDYLNIN